MNNKIYTLIFSGLFIVNMNAQSSIHTAGGEGQNNTSGSVSYSIGQPFYTTYSSNQTFISEGVQQTYKITPTTSIRNSSIKLEAIAFPNPTLDYLHLRLFDHFKDTKYQLVDIQGKIVEQENINLKTTKISMQDYASGTYLLSIFQNNEVIKTFKIEKQ